MLNTNRVARLCTCTKAELFRFFEGERVDNSSFKIYNEGKISALLGFDQNMWNVAHPVEKLMKKGNNEWFNIDVLPSGITSDEDRAFGAFLYKNFKGVDLAIDEEFGSNNNAVTPDPNAEAEGEF